MYVLMLLPLVAILVAVFNSIRKRKDLEKERIRQENIAREFAEMATRNQQEQDRWLEHYKASPITKEILDCIAVGGAEFMPRWIRVYRHKVVGNTDGDETTYDFMQRRLEFLPDGPVSVNLADKTSPVQCEAYLQNWVRQHVALAEALNWHCGNIYTIADFNIIKDESNDALSRSYYYSANDYVALVIKSTHSL